MHFFPFLHSPLYLNRSITLLSGPHIDFHIHYWGATASRFEHPVHKHSFFEVCYVVQGEGVYFEEGTSFPLKSDTLFISRPDKYHQIQYGTEMVMLFVAFAMDTDSVDDNAQQVYRSLCETNQLLANGKEAANTVYIWKALWEQAANPPAFFNCILEQLAYSLLCSFHQTFTDQETVKISGERLDNSGQLIVQAKLFIRDNLTQHITVEDVANYLFISRRHLTRLLSKDGESFTGYSRKQKIERASSLLKHKDIPIKEIAMSAGFHSLHYFTKIFTREVGITPAKFRKMF
jgi:AraC family transcriptional regulator, arabinose operon regulatory protein